MEIIRLPGGQWQYDPDKLLGPPGGFGAVYAGSSAEHGSVAVKKLKLEVRDAAHREMRITQELANRKLAHVMPILDAGKDAETDLYFVVMPQAERSLQEELGDAGTRADPDAADVMLQVAQGLSEVPDITHRDLKPPNILFHAGKWKVADFGIARFVEESTSLQTLKKYRTPDYAAPEQWRLERSTGATDIYALGCIGYALLTGRGPFPGPSIEDFQSQHLHTPPPSLPGHDPRLCSLLTIMLRKVPGTRPSLDRVEYLLRRIAERVEARFTSEGLQALAQAGAAVARQEAAKEAARGQQNTKIAERNDIAREGWNIMIGVMDTMSSKIHDLALPARVNRTPDRISTDNDSCRLHGMFEVELGGARLCIYLPDWLIPISESAFAQSAWDVIMGGTIQVNQAKPECRWDSSLWYASLDRDRKYRWWEVSYCSSPTCRQDTPFAPVALPNVGYADAAAAPGLAMYQIAYGPKPIDDEDLNTFVDRWLGRLAKAVHGQLAYPTELPLSE